MDAASIGKMLVSLIGTIAVIDLVALVLDGTKNVSKLWTKKGWVKALSFGVLGGLFGIYATIGGYTMPSGAVVSIRDVGPLMAGCLGGPWGGLIAGLIAGLHRLLIGLPDVTLGTAIPCSISTVFLGFISGFLKKPLEKSHHRPLWGFLIGFVGEIIHLLIVFIYKAGMADAATAWDILKDLALPFLFSNALAFALLFYVLDMIERYKTTAIHAEAVESELNVATGIQNSMLPRIFPDFPGRKEFSLSASMAPAKEVGGDFYDFFFTDENHLVFLIADVSGKGVPAALFMVIAKTLIKNNLQSGFPLGQAMTKTNQDLLEGDDQHMFVTCWVGLLEIDTGKLTYVNCGHNPPVFARLGMPALYQKDLSGFVLAGSKRTKYKEYTTTLKEGDKILLYTDGITEAMDKDNHQYGEKRLMDFVSAHKDQDSLMPGDFIAAVTKDVKDFTGEVAQSDDMTMLALKINGFYETRHYPATMDSFDPLSSFVNETLAKQAVPEDIQSKISIILDELFSNIVKYSKSPDLDFSLFAHQGLISLRFVYGGELYDITKAQEPDVNAPLKDRQAGGLGLLIVNKLSDKVTYEVEANKNCITVDKKYGTLTEK